MLTYEQGEVATIYGMFANADQQPEMATGDVTLTVIRNNAVITSVVMLVDNENQGYYYNWTIPTNALSGGYNCLMIATIDGIERTGVATEFRVGSSLIDKIDALTATVSGQFVTTKPF